MLTIPYLQQWNYQVSNLAQLTGALMPVIAANPPVAGGANVAPPTQAWDQRQQ